MLPDIVTVLVDNPELVVVLAVVTRLIRAWQTQLTWSEYRAIHRLKRGVFPLVYRVTRGRLHLINDKDGRDDKEFVATADASVREVVRELSDSGASLHLLCSIKRRPDTHGDPLTAAHVIWTRGDTQVEGYLFDNSDGTADLYAHTEASTDNPLEHLTRRQQDGDTVGVLPDKYGGTEKDT